MKPKNQKIEFYFINQKGTSLAEVCNKWINIGWTIHQIVPIFNSNNYWLLLYKY